MTASEIVARQNQAAADFQQEMARRMAERLIDPPLVVREIELPPEGTRWNPDVRFSELSDPGSWDVASAIAGDANQAELDQYTRHGVPSQHAVTMYPNGDLVCVCTCGWRVSAAELRDVPLWENQLRGMVDAHQAGAPVMEKPSRPRELCAQPGCSAIITGKAKIEKGWLAFCGAGHRLPLGWKYPWDTPWISEPALSPRRRINAEDEA